MFFILTNTAIIEKKMCYTSQQGQTLAVWLRASDKNQPGILATIKDTGVLDSDTEGKLRSALDSFKQKKYA